MAIASAKTYHITLPEPYTIGAQTLNAGDYHVIVNGSSAVLEDPHNKQVKINGKTENENQKFNQTAVVSRDRSGRARLDAIQIGGTHLQVDFR